MMGTIDWDQRWRDGDTPWDKGAAAPPLLESLVEDRDLWRRGGRVLAPGCGGGHDVRALVDAALPVTGLDLSPTAVAVARAAVASPRADFVCGDLFDGSWVGDRKFGTIWEHTCFCAIDPADRPRYAAAAARLLPAGGCLIGVFYLTPADAGGGPPFGASRQEILGLLEPCFVLRKERTPSRCFPGREGREWLAVFERRGSRQAPEFH